MRWRCNLGSARRCRRSPLEVLVSLSALVQAAQAGQTLVPRLEWSYLEQPSLA
jgi:hypothetical protein